MVLTCCLQANATSLEKQGICYERQYFLKGNDITGYLVSAIHNQFKELPEVDQVIAQIVL